MNIGQTELIGLSLSQSNISFPSAGIRDISEERWTVIRQRGLWTFMTTLHVYFYGYSEHEIHLKHSRST